MGDVVKDAAFSDPNNNQSNSVQNKKKHFCATLGWRGYCGIYASNSLACKCGYYLGCAFGYFSGKLRGKFEYLRLFVNEPNVAPGEASPTGKVDGSYKPTTSVVGS
jgi:hypothetical protein